MTTENTTLYPIEATYKYNGVDYPINFKDKINSTEISVVDIAALVQQIVNDIVDKDGFYPYFYDIAVYGHLLSEFSDFSNTNTLEIDKILKQSDIKQVISYNIPLIITVATNVDECIEYQKQKLVNKSEFDGLISDIRKIVDDVNERFIKPADDKVFQKLIKNLSGLKLNEKSLVDALIKAKVIDKNFSENNNKEVPKGKVINFKGQQNFDGAELVEDEIK